MSTSIDWSSLLGRQPLAPLPTIDAVTDKRVLVTGAGGSIGIALSVYIARSRPASLVLLDAAEHALYTLDRVLAAPHSLVLGSVSDPALLHALFREHRPQIVFHAAAFKHVAIVEQNPFAGIANNALATATLAEAARAHLAEQLVLVSTDKAVDPLSMMGASKRIAELILLTSPPSSTAVKIVRLANVLGSRGSVVPLFLEQLATAKPLTVTHPEVRRYFITLDECVHALTSALTCAEPHPSPGLLLAAYAGHPIPVLTLARFLSKQAGLADHPVQFTGLGPADKQNEQLLGQAETWAWPEWSAHGLRALATPTPSPTQLAATIEQLRYAVARRDRAQLLAAVQMLVPGYQPSTLLTGHVAASGVA